MILFWPLLISCTNTPHKVQKRVNSEWKFIFTERKKYIMNHEECDTLHVLFAYYNNTKQKQIIEKVKTSCGCTKVQYKHEPINSKESGNLDVAIDMRGDRGFFLKITQGDCPHVLRSKINY